MSSARKTVAALATVVSGLTLIIIGIVKECPLWLWLVLMLAALLVTGVLALVRTTAPTPAPSDPEVSPASGLPISPVERREQTVRDVLLPTCEPDYDFLFSATICWSPVDGSPELPPESESSLAVSAVLARAQEISATHLPNRASLTQHELAGALGTMQPAPTNHVAAMATDVTLRLPEADAVRLERMATGRKEKAIRAHACECDRREQLGKDILKDAGPALAQWLASHQDQLKQAVEQIGPPGQSSSATNNQHVSEQLVHLATPPKSVPEAETPSPATHADSESDDFHEAPTAAPAPSRTPAESFGALLDSMGLAHRDNEAGVLARYFSDAAAALGHKHAADTMRDCFDPLHRNIATGEADDRSGDAAPPLD